MRSRDETKSEQTARSLPNVRTWSGKVRRMCWGSLGMLALSLGVIGIFLPGLPTTPFILLAAACFSRSSIRLSKWLRQHPHFGKLIHDWEDGGRISRKAKINALLVMGIGMVIATIAMWSKPYLLGGTLLTVAIVAIYVWRRPE